MKKITTFLIMLLCASIMAWAEGWNAETIPMVHLQDSTKYVCNPDNVLTQAEVAQIDSMLNKLRLAKGVETVVVVVKKIEGGDLYTFGSDLYNKYGIGNKKQRTGLLITLSTSDRDVRIQPAYGLEGTLPDARCGKILDANIDALKDSKWGPAITGIVSTLCDEIYKDDSIQKDTSKEEEPDYSWFGFLAIFILIITIVFIQKRKSKSMCPHCKKKSMKFVSSKRTGNDGTWTSYEDTYTCKKCNYTEKINRQSRNGGGSSGAGAAGAAGSSWGSSRSSSSSWGSSGRSSGGSFGGGSYGGGGAGRRF